MSWKLLKLTEKSQFFSLKENSFADRKFKTKTSCSFKKYEAFSIQYDGLSLSFTASINFSSTGFLFDACSFIPSVLVLCNDEIVN